MNRLTCSRPDAIIVTAKPLNTSSVSPRQVLSGQRTYNEARATVPPVTYHKLIKPHAKLKKRRHIHLLEVKYCEDTGPASQLEASWLKHRFFFAKVFKKLMSLCIVISWESLRLSTPPTSLIILLS